MNHSSGYVEALIARILRRSGFDPHLAGSKEERLAFLANACAQDEVLRARLAELVANLGGEPPPIAAPTSPAAIINLLETALEHPGETDAAGSWIGSYHLLEVIGEGGFGTVWMAEQHEPVRRRVALKIVKHGMDTREVISRFEAERQALAMMDHPNIARVFDAGATESGRPYFAMELVRGVPITRYCDDTRLPASARLRLFTAVCNGVQHAHQKGVIHRDLKPSNILVTLHDGVPVAKIIDFGIAKAIGPSLTDRTLFTQFHAFIGTPAYTSPEQMEMSGLDVDTRSDIYSLGVLLYELLSGKPPFDPGTLAKSGLEAMRRVIREVDPPRPSDRLKTLSHEDRSTVADQRSTDPAKLSVLLRGDLDWIVMRCLEKDRTRRYETAGALARDVQRHLASEPVSARPPTAMYRLSKFIRRHRRGVIAFTAVLLSLVAGLVVSSTALVRERAAHARAVTAERAQAALRQQAEAAREFETRRATSTALQLANQLLVEGRVTEALAYFVHVARKDPHDSTIAPRLASVLTSHNFLLPEGPPIPGRSRVLALRFSLDGRSILAGTEDGRFRVFDADNGALTREVQLGQAVRRGGWAFAGDNDSVFAVRFLDDTIAVFDTASGRPRWPPLLSKASFGPDAGPAGRDAVQLSPDGRWLHVNGLHDFQLLDAVTGETRMNLHFTEWHFGPDFSPDGNRLALSWGDAVRVWSLPDCQPALSPIRIEGRPAPGLYLPPFFSPDGRRLVACDVWAGIHVFDAKTGEKLRFISQPPGVDPGSAGFLADGRMFLAGDRAAALLDVETTKATDLPVVFGLAAQSQRVATPDGRRLLTASIDGLVRLWDTVTGQLVAEPSFHQSETPRIALSPDGRRVLLGTSAGEIVRLRVGRGPAQPLTFRQEPPVEWHPFLPEKPARLLSFERHRASAIDVATGRIVAGGFTYPAGDAPPLWEQPNLDLNPRSDFRFFLVRDASGATGARAWEVRADGSSRAIALQHDLGAPPGTVGVAFSAAGDLVARAHRAERRIGVWNLDTGAAVGPGCAFEDRDLCLFPGIDFSPDGKWLAGGVHSTSSVVIWEVATGRPLRVIKTGADTPVEKIRFSPDGSLLLTLNDRHEAQLWDSATGEARCPPIPSTDASDAGFSPNGECFATWGPQTVRIWNGRTGAPVSSPRATGGGGVKFTKDGRRFAAFDQNWIARVWDVRSGQPVTEPTRGAGKDVWIEGFSPDGAFVQVIVNRQSSIWSVPPSPPDGAPTPEWLLRLASICAVKTIDDAGHCIDAPEYLAQIGELQRELTAQPGDAPLAAWARWPLDDSSQRAISPGFVLGPDEAGKLAARLPESGAGQNPR